MGDQRNFFRLIKPFRELGFEGEALLYQVSMAALGRKNGGGKVEIGRSERNLCSGQVEEGGGCGDGKKRADLRYFRRQSSQDW